MPKDKKRDPELRYEALKREWKRNNPAPTPEQYQAAMTALARKAGL